MPLYLVERHLPGITVEQLKAAAQAAKDTSDGIRTAGVPVHYLRSTFLPADERCFCLFDGPSADAIERVNQKANLPYEKVHSAAHIAASDLS